MKGGKPGGRGGFVGGIVVVVVVVICCGATLSGAHSLTRAHIHTGAGTLRHIIVVTLIYIYGLGGWAVDLA